MAATPSGTALVVGASGVIGWALLQRLDASPAWRTIGLARRQRAELPGEDFVAADLLDSAGLAACADRFREVTHVFVATRLPGLDAASEAEVNGRALANLLDVLETAAADLRHVCLVHGTKWYGSHLGPYRTPAREEHPRHMPPNYYFVQHDLVTARQRGQAWTWSTLRPHTVWGYSHGTGNNLVTCIGIYAALSRELGLPLRFPGPAPSYFKLSQGIDADLLAEALEWVATTPDCAKQSFNVTNGDAFRWVDLWPRIADLFGMTAAPVQTVSLERMMADKENIWDCLVGQHCLQPIPMHELANWAYLDGLFAATWDDLSSTVKAHQHGFHAVRDSDEAFLAALRRLQDKAVLPR